MSGAPHAVANGDDASAVVCFDNGQALGCINDPLDPSKNAVTPNLRLSRRAPVRQGSSSR
jgi:hypothetical protein